MSRWLKLMVAVFMVFALVPAVPARALSETPPVLCDNSGLQASGAIYCIKMPSSVPWNGGLVVFAHGYVSVTEPVGIPWDQMYLKDGAYIPDVVNSLGYAFATTSYSQNGLAVVQGQDDISDLLKIFKSLHSKPVRAYLVGASEGGLITTLMIEKHPEKFNGGMALCGPVGNFNKQINYWGKFRVAFDYYFPGVLPPTATRIPQSVIENWDTATKPGILYALSTANPITIGKLLTVTGAPIDPTDPATSTGSTVLGLLWYNVFATNNGRIVLHGQPFDNHDTQYLDPYLNQGVQRFTADGKALKIINIIYQTSGKLSTPLVTMHTTLDPIVPAWHETLYGKKVLANKGSAAHYLNISVERYGHCNFTSGEVLGAFSWLVSQP